MSLMEFRNSTITKNIDAIIHNDELTTMEKLKEIVGDNYFTNSNRAKGIYQLIQENNKEISGNHYLTSVIANTIKENCLEDFKKVANNGDISILPNAIQDMIKPEKMTVLDLIGEENAKKFFARESQNPYFLSKEVEFSKEYTNRVFVDSSHTDVPFKYSCWNIVDTGLTIVLTSDLTNANNNIVNMHIQPSCERDSSQIYAESLAKTIDFSKISGDYIKEVGVDVFGDLVQTDINRVVSKLLPEQEQNKWKQNLCDISSICNCIIYDAYSNAVAKNIFDKLYVIAQMYDAGEYEPTTDYPVFATMDKNIAEEYVKLHNKDMDMCYELVINEIPITNSRDAIQFPFSSILTFNRQIKDDMISGDSHSEQPNVDTDDIDL